MIVNGESLLKNLVIFPMAGSKRRANGVSWGLTECGYDIRIKQTVTMTPENRFQLASTVEYFEMPNHLVGVVHDKSTHARRGLSVFNTVIEPKWAGFLTLELVYHGNGELHIPAGTGIAQVLFHRLVSPASYDGKYQDQADEPVEAIIEQPDDQA